MTLRDSPRRANVQDYYIRQLRGDVGDVQDTINNIEAGFKVGFGFCDSGVYLSGEFIGAGTLLENATFPSVNFTSLITSLIPATATAVFSVVIAGVQVATITFATGGSIGTLAWSPSPYNYVAGSLIQLFAPASADATLSLVTGIIVGDPA